MRRSSGMPSTTSAACSSSKVANGEADEESNAGTGEEEDDDGDADEDAEEAADAAPVEDAAPILLETLAPFLANRPSVDFLKASSTLNLVPRWWCREKKIPESDSRRRWVIPARGLLKCF